MSPTATPPLVPSSPFASGVLASINVAKSISTSSASKRRIRLSHFFSFSAPHIGSLQMSETYSLGFMRAAASMILGIVLGGFHQYATLIPVIDILALNRQNMRPAADTRLPASGTPGDGGRHDCIASVVDRFVRGRGDGQCACHDRLDD
jgi:hypothetical protein